MINLLNLHYDKVDHSRDVAIHRGTPLGNPFSHLNTGKTKAQFIVATRGEAIEKYREWLTDKIKRKDHVICKELNRIYLTAIARRARGTDLNLVCYCSPNACHGNVIIDLINEKLEKNKKE